MSQSLHTRCICPSLPQSKCIIPSSFCLTLIKIVCSSVCFTISTCLKMRASSTASQKIWFIPGLIRGNYRLFVSFTINLQRQGQAYFTICQLHPTLLINLLRTNLQLLFYKLILFADIYSVTSLAAIVDHSGDLDPGLN